MTLGHLAAVQRAHDVVSASSETVVKVGKRSLRVRHTIDTRAINPEYLHAWGNTLYGGWQWSW